MTLLKCLGLYVWLVKSLKHRFFNSKLVVSILGFMIQYIWCDGFERKVNTYHRFVHAPYNTQMIHMIFDMNDTWYTRYVATLIFMYIHYIKGNKIIYVWVCVYHKILKALRDLKLLTKIITQKSYIMIISN